MLYYANMYATILQTLDEIFFLLLSISLILLLYKIFYHIYGLFPTKRFPDAKTQHKFAILVPARNESHVISKLLQSFADSDYPTELFDVYVIVESADDPTVEIVKKFPFATTFVRPNLNVKTKGAALDQVLRHLLSTGIAAAKDYEAYFIFDADNQVAPNYLTEMNKVFDAGYDIALGYRNSLNWNDGWVASCSALTFSMINTFQNKCRARFAQNVLVSGTGFYITAQVINLLGGWPFQTLTEDAEISYYATVHNLRGAYNEYAEFWDEQPKSLRISCTQRLRWVKGYFQVNKKYRKPMLKSIRSSKTQRLGKVEFIVNILPVVVPLVSIILYVLATFITGVVGLCTGVLSTLWIRAFMSCGVALLGCYLFFVAYAALMLLAEHRRNDLQLSHAITTCFMFPFFMALYVPIAIVALFKRQVVWTQIEHHQTAEHPTKEVSHAQQ